MRSYAYFRVDDISNDISVFFNLINDVGYNILESRVVVEQVCIGIPLEYRSKFNILINYTMESGDLLVVNGIDCLGSNFKEIISSVGFIFKKKIRLICLELSKKEITGDFKKIFFHFLKLCSNFESKVLADDNGKTRKRKKVGRPEILNKSQKEEVLEKFKEGQSIYSLAKEYSVTRTVIQRVISKSSDNSISMYLK